MGRPSEVLALRWVRLSRSRPAPAAPALRRARLRPVPPRGQGPCRRSDSRSSQQRPSRGSAPEVRLTRRSPPQSGDLERGRARRHRPGSVRREAPPRRRGRNPRATLGRECRRLPRCEILPSPPRTPRKVGGDPFQREVRQVDSPRYQRLQRPMARPPRPPQGPVVPARTYRQNMCRASRRRPHRIGVPVHQKRSPARIRSVRSRNTSQTGAFCSTGLTRRVTAFGRYSEIHARGRAEDRRKRTILGLVHSRV